MMEKILLALVAATIIVPVAMYHATGKRKGKQCLLMNTIGFFSLMAIASIAMLSGGVSAFAEGASEAASNADGLRYIGAALATGISGIGGGIAVSSAASAAIGAISENEKIMGKTLIFVALAEGIALYGLVISFMILNA